MLKVIIVGAGIGGLALAQMLMLAPETEVTCYERIASIDDGLVGFRVMLSGSTLAVLKRRLSSDVWAHLALGIGVQPEGGERVEFFKGDGEKLFTWDSDPTRDQFPVSRWQLREALLQHQTKTKPFLRLGIALERYELLPNGGARAYFSDGTTDECDVLVGADGVNSTVRKQLVPRATVRDVGMAVIYFKVPLTERSLGLLASTSRSMTLCPRNQYIMLATWQNPLAPFATRYTPHAIEPEESFVMLGAGSPVSNFHNRRCAPFGLSPAELKAELIERTGAPGIHPRFGELARMACTSTAYVHTVCKSQVITQPWASQPVTLLGDAVFNMSNTLSRGANCAVFDAATLAECLTSPADEGRSPAGMDAYVRENIERRLNERQRSFVMQNIVFPGRGSLGAFVRDMTLARALRRIDALDRGEDGAGEVGVGHEGSSNPKGEEGCVSPRWVEELRWEELFAMTHAEGKEGT